MEESTDNFKKVLKKVAKKMTKKFLVIILIIVVILSLLGSFVYFLNIDAAEYKGDDWSNTPYAASQYTGNVDISANGEIATSMTAQELWDKMIENKNNIREYLDNPKELKKLMNAEVITKFLDTRENPDEPINWDSEELTDVNSKEIQGIAKLKRADSNNNKYTMTYVDESTFQSYIDEYNSSGSEEAKQNALKHFTLAKTSGVQHVGIITGSGSFKTYEDLTDSQLKAIATVCQNEQGTTKGAAAEASLMANHMDLDINNAAKYPDTGEGLYNYIKSGGWFAGSSSYMDSFVTKNGEALRDDVLEVVKAVLVRGKRTLPGYVDEHDCFSDISSASNNGQGIDVENRSQYIQNVTKLHNVYSSNYTFYSFPDTNSDPFGYTSEENRSKIGDAYYDYESGQLVNGDSSSKSEEASDDKEEQKTEITNAEGQEMVVDVSEAIVNAAKTTPSVGTGLCLRWVNVTYQNAGLGACAGACARESYENNVVSDSRDNIPVGAAVYGSGSGNGNYGHVGIYIGNGLVMDNVNNKVLTQTLDEWIAWQEKKAGITTNGKHVKGYLGWGWPDGVNRTPELGSISSTSSSSSNGKTTYYAKVATWKEITNKAESNDPDGENYSNTTYSMTTTNINYQDMLEPFTMPFNYLWDFLIIGEQKSFVMDLADLVQNSELEITVFDNLTETTKVNVYTYTKKEKTDTSSSAMITYSYSGSNSSNTDSASGNWTDEKSNDYQTTYTTITKNNTLNVGVTLANVWMAKYTQEYTYTVPDVSVDETENSLDDMDYSEIEGSPNNNDTFGHGAGLVNQLKSKHSGSNVTIISSSYNSTENVYEATVNRKQVITTTVKENKYVSTPMVVEEKTDPKSTEPNFVTIFLDYKNEKAKGNILNVTDWLFECISINDDTKELLDLTKYLLYKATNVSYGVTEYDFGALWKKVYQAMASISAGDIIVNTDMSTEELVITDEDMLEEAIMQVYSGQTQTNLLSVLHNGTFMKLQEEYKVNAIFAIAVTIIESGGGTNWSAISSYTHNWMSMTGSYKGQSVASNGSNPRHWRVYPSFDEATLDFGDQIANGSYYFQMGKYSVKQIAPTYCNAAWGESVVAEMTKIYNAMGLEISTSSSVDVQIGEAATIQGQDARIAWLYDGNGVPTSKEQNDKYLETFPVEYLDKSGNRQTMNVTMHKKLKTEIQAIFKEMAAAGFKIIGGDISYRTWGSDAGFKGRFPQSAHTYGHAFDVNPNENYCIYGNGTVVGSYYRPGSDPYSVTDNIINIWKQHGFYWGGDWTSLKDYMHFSYFNH